MEDSFPVHALLPVFLAWLKNPKLTLKMSRNKSKETKVSGVLALVGVIGAEVKSLSHLVNEIIG